MSADDMTPDEVARFSESVAGTAASSWGRAADAPTADLAALWAAGADQGWFELGTADALASIMYVVGGGTNDIQRGLIAHALGLPR